MAAFLFLPQPLPCSQSLYYSKLQSSLPISVATPNWRIFLLSPRFRSIGTSLISTSGQDKETSNMAQLDLLQEGVQRGILY